MRTKDNFSKRRTSSNFGSKTIDSFPSTWYNALHYIGICPCELTHMLEGESLCHARRDLHRIVLIASCSLSVAVKILARIPCRIILLVWTRNGLMAHGIRYCICYGAAMRWRTLPQCSFSPSWRPILTLKNWKIL